jgi:hypothetical protein
MTMIGGQMNNNRSGIYIYEYVFICMYIYVCIYIYIYVCIFMCMCMHTCLCTYIYEYVCIWWVWTGGKWLWLGVKWITIDQVYMWLFTCTYIFVYVYVLMYIHIYINLCICMYISFLPTLTLHIGPGQPNRFISSQMSQMGSGPLRNSTTLPSGTFSKHYKRNSLNAFSIC